DSEGRSADGREVSKSLITPQDCFLPKSIGRCRGFFPSYYYNSVSKKCEYFIWSGCGGNNNRFDSRETCEKQCRVLTVKRGSEPIVKRCNRQAVPPVCNKGCRLAKDSYNCTICDCSSRKTVCNLPAVRGHCRALLPRWRYDPTTGKCTEFKFGGCNGNGNNFRTQQQCMKTCGVRYAYVVATRRPITF
ncbi:hypothetical protein Cfor_00116, partial [Coptotermes formosanus]